MAAEKRQRGYQTRYSSGYIPEYDGNAARKLERLEEAPARQGRVRRRKHAAKRLNLEVREAGKVAPFAVAGLLVVCLLAMVMLNQYASLVQVNDSVVGLRKQLTTLQTEEEKLVTQYERAYDLQAIEQELLASGEMIKPHSGQIQVIELIEPDSVKYYQKAGFGSGILTGIRDIFSAVGTYF